MSSITNLSEDLLTEILSRSSVKSIIRSKCVCKLWRKLVTTPHFPKLHLNRSNSQNPNLILTSNLSKNFQSIDCTSFDQTLTLNPNLPSSVVGISIIGSCNGLICLSDLKTFVSVWNPSINECVGLPFDPFLVPKDGNRFSVVMGFGYDHVIDVYKLVRIVFYFDVDRITDYDSCEVKVYTLGSNSWRVIRGGGEPGCLPGCYIGNNLTRVAHVNRVLHWVGIRGMGIISARSIICFDIRDEKFGEVAWPDFDAMSCRDLRLGVLNGLLSVFCYFLEHVDIWVMKTYGVHESWTRLFSVERPTKYLEPLAFLKTGDIILHMGYRELVLYDPASKRTIVPNVNDIPDRFRTGTYMESLVSVASLMASDNEEERQ